MSSDGALVLLVLAVVGGFITGAIFKEKGRSMGAGFVLGFLVPIIGVIIALAMSPTDAAREERALFTGDGKKCPQCAEVVKRDARVCRFCQHQFAGV